MPSLIGVAGVKLVLLLVALCRLPFPWVTRFASRSALRSPHDGVRRMKRLNLFRERFTTWTRCREPVPDTQRDHPTHRPQGNDAAPPLSGGNCNSFRHATAAEAGTCLPSGTRCRPSTCGAGSPPACAPPPPGRAPCRAAWRPPCPRPAKPTTWRCGSTASAPPHTGSAGQLSCPGRKVAARRVELQPGLAQQSAYAVLDITPLVQQQTPRRRMPPASPARSPRASRTISEKAELCSLPVPSTTQIAVSSNDTSNPAKSGIGSRQRIQVAKQIKTPHPPDPIMRRPYADREAKRVTHGKGSRQRAREAA